MDSKGLNFKRIVMAMLFFGMCSTLFAAGEANNTLVGKTVDYLITDWWQNLGVMIVDGVIAGYSVHEAWVTKTKTPIAYGLVAIIGITSAFSYGPDLITALRAKGFLQ